MTNWWSVHAAEVSSVHVFMQRHVIAACMLLLELRAAKIEFS